MKVCTKLSIPYLSLHLWLQVCGSFPLMQETKSISYSDLQVEPQHILAVQVLPSLPAVSVQGTAVLWWHWPGAWGIHSPVPCAAEMEPGDPSAQLGLCQGCCATSSPKLQITALSVFIHCTGPMKMLQSSSSWGCWAPPHSGTCTQWL